MERERDVKNVMSIFNLTIWRALSLPESVSTRVMLVYDKRENVKAFKVLNNRITKDMHRKITSWLEENINVYDIIGGLDSKEIDADDIPRLSNA